MSGFVCYVSYCIDKLESSMSGPTDVRNSVHTGAGQTNTSILFCSNLSAGLKFYRREFEMTFTPGPDRAGLDVYAEYICGSVLRLEPQPGGPEGDNAQR